MIVYQAGYVRQRHIATGRNRDADRGPSRSQITGIQKRVSWVGAVPWSGRSGDGVGRDGVIHRAAGSGHGDRHISSRVAWGKAGNDGARLNYDPDCRLSSEGHGGRGSEVGTYDRNWSASVSRSARWGNGGDRRRRPQPDRPFENQYVLGIANRQLRKPRTSGAGRRRQRQPLVASW